MCLWRFCAGWTIIGLCLWSGVAAAESSFSVRPNKTRIQTDQYLILDIEIRVESERDEGKMKAPNLSDWERIRVENSGTQQSITIVNGRMNRAIVKNERWILKPKRTGKLKIDAFSLRIGRKVINSRPFVVQVGGSRVQNRSTNRQPAQGTPRSARRQTRSNEPAVSRENSAFLRWSVTNKRPFVGEAIVADLELVYSPALRPTHSGSLEGMDFRGFWTQKLEQAEQREWQENIQGTPFQVQHLVRYRLVPLTVSVTGLPDVAVDLELSTIERRRGGFFGSRQVMVPWGEINASSRPQAIEVRGLPTENKPSGFRRASVGNTRLKAKVSQNRIRGDGSVDLVVETITEGLIQNFPETNIGQLTDFDVYPAQTKVVTEAPAARRYRAKSEIKVRQRRSQTFLLRPKRAGRLKIPSFSLAYFDPLAGDYRRAKTRPLYVQVEGKLRPSKGSTTIASASPKTPKSSFRSLSRDQKVMSSHSCGGSISVFFGLCASVPFGWLLMGLFFRRQRLRERTSQSRQAHVALKSAKNMLSKMAKTKQGLNEKAEALKQIALVFADQRTQRSMRGLAYDDLAEQLRALGGQESVSRLVEWLEALDYERFSGQLNDASLLQFAERMTQILSDLDNELEVAS